MKDRLPLYPGRVKMVPVAGQENVYDMTRADQPTQEGDPLNKATLLQDTTAALFGFGTDAVPDDVLAYVGKYAQHWWKRRSISYKKVENQISEATQISNGRHNDITIKYSDSVNVDQKNGNVTLLNPKTTQMRPYNGGFYALSELAPCYFTGSYTGEDKVFYLPKGSTYGNQNVNYNSYTICLNTNIMDVFLGIPSNYRCSIVTSEIGMGDWEYVQSSSRSAYPDSGEKDGYEYQYLGIPFENAATAPKIAAGSYVGTGKYGQSNPNSLTADFEPKMVVIRGDNRGGFVWVYESDQGIIGTYTGESVYLEWLSNGLKWYSRDNSGYQLNNSGKTYRYIMLG